MDAAAVADFQKGFGLDRDIAERILGLFVPPDACEQVAALFKSCRPYEVRGNDSPADVQRFLMDFTPFQTSKVPSTTVPPRTYYSLFEKPDKTSDSKFANLVGSLLSTPEMTGSGEEYVAAESIELQKLWTLLDSCNPNGRELGITFWKNVSERGSQYFNVFQTGARPDSIGTCNGSLLLYSKEKKEEENVMVAVDELTLKLGELPSFLYGKLKFLLCYAATPQSLRFYIMQPSRSGPQLHQVVPLLLKNNPLDQTRIVLMAIKVYFLLLGMVQTVSTQPKYRLNRATKHGWSIIKLNVRGSRKIIPRWDEYEQVHGVKLETVKLAYVAARNANNHLVSSVLMPKLIKASELSETEKAEVEYCTKLIEASELSKTSETERAEIESCNKLIEASELSETERAESSEAATEIECCNGTSIIGSKRKSFSTFTSSSSKKRKGAETSLEPAAMVYVVETRPLCGVRIPATEADLREMATGVLCALKALHSAGLVHRDISEPNVMYDYERNRYVLIDLEGVCQAGEKPCLEYDCWDMCTLDGSGAFTEHSDYRLLGLLLGSYAEINTSSQCQEFIDLLLGKQEDVDKLLQHSWLSKNT